MEDDYEVAKGGLESIVGRMAREYNDPERHMREIDETIHRLESLYLATPSYTFNDMNDDLPPPFEVLMDEEEDKN